MLVLWLPHPLINQHSSGAIITTFIMSLDYDDAEAVRALSQTEVNRLNNAQLKRALSTVLNAERAEEPSNNDLLNEIREIKESLQKLNRVKVEVKSLKTKLN